MPIQKEALFAFMGCKWIGEPERTAMRVKGAEAWYVA